MNFEEAGAVLRAEREKRNLSIEDVGRQLKISPRQLRALESGDLASLPHPAYAKGFIRSYASWLGISLDDLRAPEKKTMDKGGADNDVTVEMPAPEQGEPTSLSWLWILLILILCGAGGWYAWQQNFWGLFETSRVEKSDLTDKLPRADTYLASKKDETTSRPAPPEKSAPVTSIKPENTVSAPVELPEAVVTPPSARETAAPAQIEAAPNPGNNQEPAPTANVPKPLEQTAEPGNHKLIITAIEECWVHSNSDKTDTRQFSLRKGDTFALTFAETLELKLGNAGGVRLRYDGKDLPAPGTSGQVKTITFPPAE